MSRVLYFCDSDQRWLSLLLNRRANILGFDIDEFEDDTFEYDCIGVIHTKNRARVYHGILQKGSKFLKVRSKTSCSIDISLHI